MKIKFNFIQSNFKHKIVLLFSGEIWNKDDKWKEIRINILFWEFNFNIKY